MKTDIHHVLHGKSHALLSDDEAIEARAFVYNWLSKNPTDKSFNNAPFNLAKLHQIRHTLPDFSARLARIDGRSLSFRSPIQKKEIENELIFLFCNIYAQYQIDLAQRRKQNLADLEEKLQTIGTYLQRLQSNNTSPEGTHADLINTSTLPMKFAVLRAAHGLGKTIPKVIGKDIVTAMSDYNSARLWAVWGLGAGFLGALAEYLSEESKNKTNDILEAPGTFGGYMSWMLYYARFGMNLSLLLKHTFRSSKWMSKQEYAYTKEIPAWERFTTQFAQRKFTLLNDSLWATANLAGFYWLKGGGWRPDVGTAGYSGNAMMAVLLLFDVCMCTWDFIEEQTRHNKELLAYEKTIADLKLKINSTTTTEERSVLRIELHRLIKDKQQFERDWKYKRYHLINNLAYAVGLVLGFVVFCGFFIAPPLVVLLTPLVGATLCFVFNVLTHIAKGTIDISQMREEQRVALDEYKSLQTKDSDEYIENEQNLRVLYLESQRLKAQSDHLEKRIAYHKKALALSIFLEAFLPAVLLGAAISLPFGVGLALVPIGLAFISLSRYLTARFEPKKPDLVPFSERHFQLFKAGHSPSKKETPTSTDNESSDVEDETSPFIKKNV